MRIGGVALVIAAAAAGVSGCNLADSGTNLVNGKEQFVANCGACHVLSRAGTTGTAGPNLDEAFQRARKDGFGESTFEGLVLAQIQNPNKNPSFNPATERPEAIMPADIVTGEDAEDVAAYVASAAGRAGEDTGQLAQLGAAQAEGTAEAADGVLDMPATGATNYEFADATAPPGGLTIRSPNESPTEHNIALEGGGVNEEGPVV
ncbi:MAG TPA: cytochrome c, partial [Solirubrobacteraceae bacterium]|nr:cytochrome c [Solirubrobacteraceae bacterium]